MKTNLFLIPISAVVTIILTFRGVAADEPPVGLIDFSAITMDDLKLEPVNPELDPKTGFVVGGENTSVLISTLTEINGHTISDLESNLRPGAFSDKGFLGSDESLLKVLVEDNQYVVQRMKTTHQKLARELRLIAAIGIKIEGKEFWYRDRRMKVTIRSSRGFQESPFHDGLKSNSDVTVCNLSNGKTLTYSLLVPDLVERYGFYEGHSTPYRVEPRQVLCVLDFLTRDADQSNLGTPTDE
jgi:hypothetical protein